MSKEVALEWLDCVGLLIPGNQAWLGNGLSFMISDMVINCQLQNTQYDVLGAEILCNTYCGVELSSQFSCLYCSSIEE